MTETDYRKAPDSERLSGIIAGDPVGNYFGFPEVQRDILQHEIDQGALGVADTERLPATVFDTLRASERLLHVMAPTPLEYASRLSEALGVTVFFKREDLTPVHSFKIRGAYNKMAQLTELERNRGVLAASAGNHAQGVALSARELGINAAIVMPTTTPEIKIEAVKRHGAQVILAGDNYSEAYEYSQELIDESGKVYIHPFDDDDVITGQSTVGKEILDDCPNVTHIFIPVGGGGLIAGIGRYVKSLRPDVRIIGVEPEDSNAMQASLETGYPQTLSHVGRFADGVAVKRVGDLTFDLSKEYVDEVLTVTNDQIAAAMETFYDETRGMLEPAGALAIAGIHEYHKAGQLNQDDAVAAVCSGANMSFSTLRFVAERNEIGRGREALFAITLPEIPGALMKLCQEVINGHNITELKYRLSDRNTAHIFVGFNIAGEVDKQNFLDKLADNNYSFYDLSDDDFAKEHVRHMVGGSGEHASNEHLYQINFPEKPGALTTFLEALGDEWNISLFHYRGIGGDTGSVLIGFESPNVEVLEEILSKISPDYQPVNSPTVSIFL